jgi:hypothetical protein
LGKSAGSLGRFSPEAGATGQGDREPAQASGALEKLSRHLAQRKNQMAGGGCAVGKGIKEAPGGIVGLVYSKSALLKGVCPINRETRELTFFRPNAIHNQGCHLKSNL